MEVKILARDNDKDCNRQLIEFLNKTLEPLVARGVRFKFRVVAESELDAVVKSGIKRLPVGIINGKTYTGSVEIKSFLTKIMGQQSLGSKPLSSGDEDLSAFYAQEMTPEAKERDEHDDDSDNKRTMTDVVRKATEAMQERSEMHKHEREKTGFTSKAKPGGKRADNIRPPPTRPAGASEHRETHVDVKRAAQTGDKDDQLVAGMFDETAL